MPDRAHLTTIVLRVADGYVVARAPERLSADLMTSNPGQGPGPDGKWKLHLPGKHDQDSHGGSGGGATLTGKDALSSVPKGLFVRGSMTPPQRKALGVYETGWSLVINSGVLRSDRWDDPDYADEVKVIDQIDTAMDDSVLPNDITVHRGMFLGRQVFGDRLDGDLTGFSWRDAAYGSTTANEEIVEVFHAPGNDDNIRMTVHVPAGTKALATSTFEKGSKANGPQAEITLQRGMRWTVEKDNGYDAGGARNLEVRVDPPADGDD